MTCNNVTELLLLMQIIARSKHLPRILSTIPQLVSSKPQAFTEQNIEITFLKAT